MKNFFFLLFSIFISTSLLAQDNLCESSYMPFKEGAKLEYANFDKKGKKISEQRQTVSKVVEIDGGFSATIELTLIDKKGNETSSSSFDIECQDGTVRMDMSKMVNPAMMAGYENMEVEIVGEDIEFPNNLTEGQELPDGTMEVKTNMSGLGAMSTTVQMTERKVEAFETITTPAGTFDCVKITQTTTVKVMGITRSSKSSSWLAKGIGTVKTESLSPKGKLESTMELTSIER